MGRKVSKDQLGSIAENIIQQFFKKLGYGVFPNDCPQGPIDLIVLNYINGKKIYVDCKQASRREKDGEIINRTLTPIQKKLGVHILYVDINTYEVKKYPFEFGNKNVQDRKTINNFLEENLK